MAHFDTDKLAVLEAGNFVYEALEVGDGLVVDFKDPVEGVEAVSGGRAEVVFVL